jgi:hypothetical protein
VDYLVTTVCQSKTFLEKVHSSLVSQYHQWWPFCADVAMLQKLLVTANLSYREPWWTPIEQSRRLQVYVGLYIPYIKRMDHRHAICAPIGKRKQITNGTMSSAILVTNFPTLVPPYFCTNHLEDGSMVFWCIFGGVRGGGLPEDSEPLEGSDWDMIVLLETLRQMEYVYTSPLTVSAWKFR